MVRRPAAVLVALVVAQLYLLLAPEVLPVIGDDDVALLVAAGIGSSTVVLSAACAVTVTDVKALGVLLALGSGLMVAALNVAGVGAAATMLEAAAYASVGALFALGLLSPQAALALPVLVGIVDIVSSTAGGPSELLGQGATQDGDALSLAFPDWGTQLPAGRLGITDAVFAGVFLLFARRLGLRFGATAVALWVAVLVAIVLHLWLDESIPVLPLMAAGYYLVNLDRLPALLRAAPR